MTRSIGILLSSALLIVLSSCSESIIVPVDTFPLDSTISEVELENYVNKTHIALLNRKPTSEEFNNALSLLQVDPYDRGIRDSYILGLQSEPEVRWVAWQFLSDRLLEGIDTAQIYSDQQWYLDQSTTSGSQGVQEYWQFLYGKSTDHISAMEGWFNGDTTYSRLQTWMVRLNTYDEINMGTENFVVSVYQHFYHRYPSDLELEQASEMVEGDWGILHGINGNSKADFLNIIFNQGEYQQGRIITFFEGYLKRMPTSSESVEYVNRFYNGWDFWTMQRYILTSSEYVNS